MPKALQDITVLDFSHLLQGPFATQLLGDMGANIIKVERPGQGDLFRTMTFKNRWVGGTESPNFLAWNRNKRSLAIDLKAPEARSILYKIGGASTWLSKISGRASSAGARVRLCRFPQDQSPHHLLFGLGLRRQRPLCDAPRAGHADPRADRHRGRDRPRGRPRCRSAPDLPIRSGP